MPAALALGETFGIDGMHFLRAVTLGYDIGMRAMKTLLGRTVLKDTHNVVGTCRVLGRPPNPSNLQFTAKIAELCHIMRHSPEGYIVAQGVQRHTLPSPGRPVEQPVELAGRHRLAGPTTRKQPAFLKGYRGIEAPAHRPPLSQQTSRLRA